MSEPKEARGPDIPVVCGVCGTRSYAHRSQVGQEIVCPDCSSRNRVPPPPPPPAKFQPRFTGDEYQLSAVDEPARRVDPERRITFPCSTCSTLLDASREEVGSQVSCPDCGNLTVVPPPPPEPPRFQPVDASDIVLDEPPSAIQETRKRIADQLMKEAEEYVRACAEEESKPPLKPLVSGVFTFPFQPPVIPVWIGATIGVVVLLTLVDLINSMTRVLSLEAILAVFTTIIAIFFAAVIAGFCLPPLLAIIEFTADGQDRIPYWPGSDLLDRGRALLFFVNSLAVSSLPGMLTVSLLRPLGVPLWTGMLLTPLLWPVVFLSMLEADSPFIPWSPSIRASLKQISHAWSTFYFEMFGVTVLLAIPALVLRLVGPLALRVYLAAVACYLVIVCCRLLGRLAWMAAEYVEEETEEEPDEESVEEQEGEADHDAAGRSDRTE